MDKVTANGHETVLGGDTRLTAFLLKAGWKPTQIVVELNGEVVPREKIGEIHLKDGDRIEVIVPVAGG
jgi:thiamine biosynthesis protein ThiS